MLHEKISSHCWNQWELKQKNNSYGFNGNTSCEKNKFGYFYELKKFPKASIIFIAFCFACVNYVKTHGGVCLLCSRDPEIYDLSFCCNKEFWILCIEARDFVWGDRLVHLLLNYGAVTVTIIPFNKDLLLRGNYGA